MTTLLKKNMMNKYLDYPFEEGSSFQPDEGTHTFQSHSTDEGRQRGFPDGCLQPEFLMDV